MYHLFSWRLATAINSYGATDNFDQTTNIDPTVDPYVNVVKINIGNIEVTKKPQTLEFGKNNKINQKGKTPIFIHKYIVSTVKNEEICSIIFKYIILKQ